jgi:Fe-S cluster assembly iron-binding protein IscA
LGLALEELKKEEELHTVNEIEVLIDEGVKPYVEESEIDYISSAHGEGFSINAGSSC